MDILATWVGYKHNQDPNVPMGTAAHHTMGVITARVDRMDIALEAQFRSDEDLILHGYVSWVGKSSMEVTIDITQNDADQVPKLQMTAKYVMVTMTPEFKAAPNVTLSLRDERDRQLFEMGARAKDLRTQRDKTAVGLVMPTLDELNILREQELKIMDPLTLTSHRSRLSEGHALMDDAKLANSVICMPLETNLHGTVFGGFLIRTSYETAWANASVFANGPVNCTAITNALYPRAIRLGSLLYINSQVCYTHERLLQTLVTCRVRNPKTGNLETTNVFHFTFEAEAPVRSLIPGNYADGLRYIHCRRELEYAVAKAALATEVQQ